MDPTRRVPTPMRFWIEGLRTLPLLLALAATAPAAAQPEPLAVGGGAAFALRGPTAPHSIHVVLPRGYDPDRAEPYPVLYVADAWWLRELVGGVARVAEEAGAAGIEPVVLVGIGVPGDADAWNRQRNRDFTPSPFRARPGITLRSGNVALDSAGTGGAAEFLAFLRDELFPRIEAEYAVDPHRRGWLGHSFGGLFGAWAAGEAPGIFADLLLVSPAVWWSDEEVTRRGGVAAGTKVFLAYGAAEFGPIPRTVPPYADALAAAGARVELRPYAGRDHTSVLPPAIWDGLVYLYGR